MVVNSDRRGFRGRTSAAGRALRHVGAHFDAVCVAGVRASPWPLKQKPAPTPEAPFVEAGLLQDLLNRRSVAVRRKASLVCYRP